MQREKYAAVVMKDIFIGLGLCNHVFICSVSSPIVGYFHAYLKCRPHEWTWIKVDWRYLDRLNKTIRFMKNCMDSKSPEKITYTEYAGPCLLQLPKFVAFKLNWIHFPFNSIFALSGNLLVTKTEWPVKTINFYFQIYPLPLAKTWGTNHRKTKIGA